MTRRITIGPFNRVEGDLEVHLDIKEGQVKQAYVNSTLYRGFEQILHGRHPGDALVYTPRICGICSVSQSAAAASALADAYGVETPPNGHLARSLIHACENLADHFTHFYLFFMPDFAREAYAGEPWYAEIAERFKAIQGKAAAEVLPARAQWMNMMGLLAGKWPHTLSLQPGGSARAIEAQERVRLLALVGGFRRFLENVLFGDSLEAIAALDSTNALENYRDHRSDCDLRRFLNVADALGLDQQGRAYDRFMSYGAYPDADGQKLFSAGLWQNGDQALDPTRIREDISHSWMDGPDAALHPSEGITRPDADREQAYSWCKAPRLDGFPVEVGALARQQVNGHPLIRELVAQDGGNVRNRVIARLLELALVVPAMEDWLKAIEPGEPFCTDAEAPDEAEGVGLVEAARGSLGHWAGIRKGRLINYQIVAPTTWNFSPRDTAGIPGPLEKALEGTLTGSEDSNPVSVQHIVRSFDPCMVCTVH